MKTETLQIGAAVLGGVAVLVMAVVAVCLCVAGGRKKVAQYTVEG